MEEDINTQTPQENIGIESQQQFNSPTGNNPFPLLSKRNIFIIIAAFALILLIPVMYLSFSKKSINENTKTTESKSPVEGKIWEITFSYDRESQKLSLKNALVKEGVVGKSLFQYSAYQLSVYNKERKILFNASIPIAEEIIYNIEIDPNAVSSGAGKFTPPLGVIESVISVPYFDQDVVIEVEKNKQKVLEFNPPKSLGINLISNAFASACSTVVNIVFVSEGYTDFNKFHQDVDRVKNAFLATQPYSTKQEMFDLNRAIENSNSLGCKSGSSMNINCLSSPQRMRDLVFDTYQDLPRDSDHTKIIVIVDGTPQPVAGGSILGAVNMIGGQYGVFQNRSSFIVTAVHEVLGHGIGMLYDRYVISGYGNLLGSLRSNCTNNSNGESFWASAGVSGAYPGCKIPELFAPEQPTCPGGGSMVSGGTMNSLMSAGQCTATEFDAVEKYWITNNILPMYSACSGGGGGSPTATPIPGGSGGSVPTATPVVNTPGTFSITGKIYVDNNGNRRYDSGDEAYRNGAISISGTATSATTTNNNGDYAFSNLAPGSYSVSAVIFGVTRDNGPYTLGPSMTLDISTSANNTVAPTATPIPGGSGGSGGGRGGSGGSGGGSTAAPTPIPYNCVPDPNCATGKSNVQICALKCSPQ